MRFRNAYPSGTRNGKQGRRLNTVSPASFLAVTVGVVPPGRRIKVAVDYLSHHKAA